MKDNNGIDLPVGLIALLHPCTRHDFEMFKHLTLVYEVSKSHESLPELEALQKQLSIDVRKAYDLTPCEYKENYELIKKAYDLGWGSTLGSDRYYHK